MTTPIVEAKADGGSGQSSLERRILRALMVRPQHGFGLIRALSGVHTPVDGASLYPVLHQLARAGHVTGSWERRDGSPRARIYSLTRAGEIQLRRLAARPAPTPAYGHGCVAVCAGLVAASVTQGAVLPDETTHVRPLSPRLARAVELLDRRSASFSAVVRRLEESDVIVHLIERKGGCDSGVKSCLAVVGRRGGYRYVRIQIASMQSYDAVLAQIAHELQHAVEVAGDARVHDSRTSLALCDRIGWRAGNHCETRAAQGLARQVLSELGDRR
jgi:DNA-binding PadR family transcriptional regulator